METCLKPDIGNAIDFTFDNDNIGDKYLGFILITTVPLNLYFIEILCCCDK